MKVRLPFLITNSLSVAMVTTMALLMASPASAKVIGLPPNDLFVPLLADPKEPRFVVSFLSTKSATHDTAVAAVAYGEHYGFARWPGA